MRRLALAAILVVVVTLALLRFGERTEPVDRAGRSPDTPASSKGDANRTPGPAASESQRASHSHTQTPGALAQDREQVPAWDSPKRATFCFEREPLSTVVEAMSACFGQKIALQAGGWPLISFEARDLTFLEAFERLAQETRLELVGLPKEVYWDGWDELGLRPLPPNSPDVLPVPLGPSRLSIRRIGTRQFMESGPADVVVEMCWLAGTELSRMAIIGWDLDAIRDDTGATLRWRRDSHHFRRLPLRANAPFELVLARPPHPEPRPKVATSIPVLSGRIRIAIPLAYEEATFLANQKGEQRRLGSSVITFQGVDGDPPTLAFVILRTPCSLLDGSSCYPAGPPVGITTGRLSYFGERPPIDAITIALYDEHGREVGGGGRTEHCGGEHRLALARPPQRIVFRAVTKAALRDVRFGFVGIPLSK